MLDLDAAPYGGARFPVTSSMAGKPFVNAPPDFWSGPYSALAQECGLPEEIMSGFIKVSDFLGSLVIEREP